MTKNMTVGSPFRLIISFSVPLIIGNIFQQLYSMADSYIVSATIGTHALAAVGCTGSVNFMILGFIIGFTQGASIITSQRFGAGDERGLRRSFACGVIISALITAFLMLLSILALRPLLTALNTPAEIYEDAWIYMVTILWGMPAITLFNICSSMMRAVGDSKTPLYFLIVACVINIALDYLFILVFHMGVFGAGFATVLAQLASGLMCIPAIQRRLPLLCIQKEDWKIGMLEVREQIRVALPVAFQWSIIAIGALAVTFSINGFGTVPVAALTTGQRIEQLAGMPLGSIGAAMTTYAAQNFGAKKLERISKGVWQGTLIALSFAALMGVLFVSAGGELARLFLKGEEAGVAMAHEYLTIQGVFFFSLGLLFVFRQTLVGLGNTLVPTIAGVMELVMRAMAALLLAIPFGFTGICLAGPLAWLGALLPLSLSLLFTLKRLKRFGIKRLPLGTTD